MERKYAIQNAYKLAGSNRFYDGMITCSTVGGKAVSQAVRGMIDTTDGMFMTKKEASCLMLQGSTLLVGRK